MLKINVYKNQKRLSKERITEEKTIKSYMRKSEESGRKVAQSLKTQKSIS